MRTLMFVAMLGMPLATLPAQSGARDLRSTYLDFQVDSQARPVEGTAAPRYPEQHRATKKRGEVLVQFVVDTSGTIAMETFRILMGFDSLFVQSVRDALPEMRFVPAYLGRRKVRQLVQLPFSFSTK